jgi:hypothetical protein
MGSNNMQGKPIEPSADHPARKRPTEQQWPARGHHAAGSKDWKKMREKRERK